MRQEMRKKCAVVFRTLKPMTGTYAIAQNVVPLLARDGWEVHIFAGVLDKKSVRNMGAVPHKIWAPKWGKTLRLMLFDKLTQMRLSFRSFDLVWGHGDILEQDVLSLHNCVHKTHENIQGRPAPDIGVAYFHQRLLKEGRFSKLIANSDLMKSDVVERYGVDPDVIEVIHPGYSPDVFNGAAAAHRKAAARARIEVPDDAFLIGLVTSGDFLKRGVKRFFEALGQLPPPLKERAAALIVGKEKNLRPYRLMADHAGLRHGAIFLEPIKNVADYYAALDVMVYPAYFEEFGISVLEAVMSGVPVVTVRAVGAAELLGGEARSFIYQEFNPQQMASGVARLLTDSALRNRVVEDGQRSMAPYSWANYFSKIIGCLNGVHAKKRDSLANGL